MPKNDKSPVRIFEGTTTVWTEGDRTYVGLAEGGLSKGIRLSTRTSGDVGQELASWDFHQRLATIQIEGVSIEAAQQGQAMTLTHEQYGEVALRLESGTVNVLPYPSDVTYAHYVFWMAQYTKRVIEAMGWTDLPRFMNRHLVAFEEILNLMFAQELSESVFMTNLYLSDHQSALSFDIADHQPWIVIHPSNADDAKAAVRLVQSHSNHCRILLVHNGRDEKDRIQTSFPALAQLARRSRGYAPERADRVVAISYTDRYREDGQDGQIEMVVGQMSTLSATTTNPDGWAVNRTVHPQAIETTGKEHVVVTLLSAVLPLACMQLNLDRSFSYSGRPDLGPQNSFFTMDDEAQEAAPIEVLEKLIESAQGKSAREVVEELSKLGLLNVDISS